MNGIQWQPLQLPFAAGLAQRADDRARPQPYLDIAKDVQFDETGGVQARKPFAAIGADIYGGGTISNARRLVANGDELLLFTKDTLYSWNAQVSKWISKATHLAVKVAESATMINTAEQIDGDRAELAGVVFYVWVEAAVTYVAAIDKTTGAVILNPASVGIARPRLVALTTKVLLIGDGGGNNLDAIALDPAAPASAVATTVVSGAFNSYFDVERIPGADTAIIAYRRVTTTSYGILKLTAALAVTATTKARTCSGAIAVAVDPTGANVQVLRGSANALIGDLLVVSSFADVFTAQALGTAGDAEIWQIAAAYRSTVVSGSVYRCYVWWHAEENVGSSFDLKKNVVDTDNTVGAAAVMNLYLGLASRAFSHDGRVFVWTVFAQQTADELAAQLQNTYFLFEGSSGAEGTHTSSLHAKAVAGRCGGFSTRGRLPGVTLTGGTTTYSWCGLERRVIPLGGDQAGYADRGPVDISITFDSNEARRCERLGSTLYVTGGELLQYDGIGLTEVGFHVYPWKIVTAVDGGGSILDGTYSYKSTLRWVNAVGDQDRSTTASVDQAVVVSSGDVDFTLASLTVTHKSGSRRAVAHEIWRTTANPTAESPFYLITSKDPTVLSGNNRYVANSPTVASPTVGTDALTDTLLASRETDPETGDVLESLAPPACTIIAATADRLFLGGVAGDPHSVWYSKLRGESEVASFHDVLRIPIPRPGGAITAIAFLNETLIVFRETAIYSVTGEGATNTGQGLSFAPARALAHDVGAVSHEAVALTPEGLLFKSSKGWYLLNGGGAVTYVGSPISDSDADTVVAIDVIESQHQVRVLSTARMLVLDTAVGQWSEWTISDGVHSTSWDAAHLYLTATGPKRQATTYSSLTYGLDVETAWIKLADLQGAAAVRRILALGEYRSAHYLRVRIAYNYLATYVDDKSWLATPTTVAGPLQLKHGPRRPHCEAIKVRLTAMASSVLDASTLSQQLPLSVGSWSATLTGVASRTFSIGATAGTTASVEVRDGEKWDGAVWTALANNCGVKIVGNNTTATLAIATIEAAINASSALVAVTTAHVGVRTVDFTAFAPGVATGSFAEASPTGEALKLTGLGLEIGIKPVLYRRLPAAQRQ